MSCVRSNVRRSELSRCVVVPDEDLWSLQGFRSRSGHMLPGAEWHPPLLWRHQVRGQLHQYSLLTSLLDPWRTSWLCFTLLAKVQNTTVYVTFTERQWGSETQAVGSFMVPVWFGSSSSSGTYIYWMQVLYLAYSIFFNLSLTLYIYYSAFI